MRFSFLEKKSIGAAKLKQSTFVTKVSNKRNSAFKFTAQNWSAPQIIGISVAPVAGKVLTRVVGRRIEILSIGACKLALQALPDVATVDSETKSMVRSFGACRARTG